LLNGLGEEDPEFDKMEENDDKNENNNNDKVEDDKNVNMDENNNDNKDTDTNENNDENKNDDNNDDKDEDTDMENNDENNNNNLVANKPFTLPPPDEKRLAEREITDTIGYDDEIAYLDIDLTEEKNVLTEYYTLIQQLQGQNQNN